MTQLLLLCSVLVLAAVLTPALCKCDLAACQSKVPVEGSNETQEEQCTQAKEAITCAVSTLLTNPDCTENIKMIVRKKVEEGRSQVTKLCGGGGGGGGGGGAAGLLASLAVCLGLSALTHCIAFFQSRAS